MTREASTPSDRLVAFVHSIRWPELPEAVRHAIRRHALDTFGAMIVGASSDLTATAASVLMGDASTGQIPLPGGRFHASPLDFAYLGGAAIHGLELDDGYRLGSVHPGSTVLPAALAAAWETNASGERFLEACVAGYETVTAIAEVCHPDLRFRGFHPTGAIGVFGAAVAAAVIFGLDARQTRHALGLAASSSAGLYAFINGGADVKRLHAGHAAREGLFSALLARKDVEGPPDVLTSRDGFLQAFAFGRERAPRLPTFPPEAEFRLPECYIKPYPCCRHVQPAIEALIAILDDHGLRQADIARIHVETYAVAAEYAHTGWEDFASAQLSFGFLMALAAHRRWIRLDDFGASSRADPTLNRLARLVDVSVAPELDALYPARRPARVILTMQDGRVLSDEKMEALGARETPFSDERLMEKFQANVSPSLGAAQSARLGALLWSLDSCESVQNLMQAVTLDATAINAAD